MHLGVDHCATCRQNSHAVAWGRAVPAPKAELIVQRQANKVFHVSAPELYIDFFGFSERPFNLNPDPDFLFWSPEHKSAFAVLEYGVVARSPITVLTGEIGAGKTTLLQKLLSTIETDTTIGLISNAQGGRGELLRWVLNALSVRVEAGDDYVSMYQMLQDFLLSEYAEGRRVALVIDEAQNLSVEALEELRMMTNINANKDELLQLIIVGQPELRNKFMRPDLQQFAQRVGSAFHLGPLDQNVIGSYISHRLQHVGGTGEEFSEDAIAEIYEQSRGVPRLINKLCDFCLVYAGLSETLPVTGEIVRQVVADGVYVSGFLSTESAAQ